MSALMTLEQPIGIKSKSFLSLGVVPSTPLPACLPAIPSSSAATSSLIHSLFRNHACYFFSPQEQFTVPAQTTNKSYCRKLQIFWTLPIFTSTCAGWQNIIDIRETKRLNIVNGSYGDSLYNYCSTLISITSWRCTAYIAYVPLVKVLVHSSS